MMSRFHWIYPFLLAAVPVLNMYAAYPGQTSLDDLGVVLGSILLGCAAVYLLAWLALAHQDSRLASLVTVAAVAWFYCYGRLATQLGRIVGPNRHLILVPIGLLLTLGLIAYLRRRPVWLQRLGLLLSLMGVLLVGQLVIRILLSRSQSLWAQQHSALIQRLSQPITVRAGFVPRGPRRDIYLIILDEYANSAVTAKLFGFDNHLFEDSLRRLGFFIPPVVKSNYLHTTLSLPSLLNASQLVELASNPGRGSKDPTVPNYLVENSRTVTFLKAQGYRFVFFPSQWWLSTRHNRHADVQFRVWSGLSGRELSHTELRRAVRLRSLLDEFQTDLGDDVDHLQRTLQGIAQTPQLNRGTPNFVMAHLMKPHRPFGFDQECRALPRHAGLRRIPAAKRSGGYAGQLKCLNTLLLELVDTLIRTSKVPPVILLQGDHGTKTMHASALRSVDAITPAAAWERTGAFGAYYLPAGGAAAFGDTVTVVNVLGHVLRYYLGADLKPEPNEFYLSVARAPYRFRRVDWAWLEQGEALTSRAAR